MSSQIDNYTDITLKSNPVVCLTDHELDMIILRMGSFLSIISNKKSNQAKLVIATLNDEQFRDVFLSLADIDNLQLLIKCILVRYPTVCKSKIILNSIGK